MIEASFCGVSELFGSVVTPKMSGLSALIQFFAEGGILVSVICAMLV